MLAWPMGGEQLNEHIGGVGILPHVTVGSGQPGGVDCTLHKLASAAVVLGVNDYLRGCGSHASIIP